MNYHYKVSGLDMSGNDFIGECVAKSIIDAINLFQQENYSVHNIKQDGQVPADYPCVITYLESNDLVRIVAGEKRVRCFECIYRLNSDDNYCNKHKCTIGFASKGRGWCSEGIKER